MNFCDIFKSDPKFNRVKIDNNLVKSLEEYVTMFETRGSHSQALNTHLLAVFPINFTATDKEIFFSIIGVDETDVSEVLRKSSHISENWKVVNDPFNQMIVYLSYRILNAKNSISYSTQDRALLAVYKMLYYKIFTSYIYNAFQYGADKNIMEVTIKGLSKKFDIVQLGTWKKVIEQLVLAVYSPESKHLQTLQNYNSDVSIIYVITDIRAGITGKIKLIQNAYYENHANEETMGSYGMTGVDTEGEMTIIESDDVFNRMITNLQNQVQTTSRFIDNDLIDALCAGYSYIQPNTLRYTLTIFSELASTQNSSGDMNLIYTTKGKDKTTYYVGANIFIETLVQKIYRFCILNKVDMQPIPILNKAKDLFTSSRISDPDILMLKRSAIKYIEDFNISNREKTVSTLAILLIRYLLVRSFMYL